MGKDKPKYAPNRRKGRRREDDPPSYYCAVNECLTLPVRARQLLALPAHEQGRLVIPWESGTCWCATLSPLNKAYAEQARMNFAADRVFWDRIVGEGVLTCGYTIPAR